MLGGGYFGAGYFGAGYFASGAAASPPTTGDGYFGPGYFGRGFFGRTYFGPGATVPGPDPVPDPVPVGSGGPDEIFDAPYRAAIERRRKAAEDARRALLVEPPKPVARAPAAQAVTPVPAALVSGLTKIVAPRPAKVQSFVPPSPAPASEASAPTVSAGAKSGKAPDLQEIIVLLLLAGP